MHVGVLRVPVAAGTQFPLSVPPPQPPSPIPLSIYLDACERAPSTVPSIALRWYNVT